MASVKKSDIPEVSEFMPEFWTLIKAFWVPEDGDGYWGALADYADKLYKRHPTLFSRRMIAAYMGYLEEKWDLMKKEGRA